MLYNKHLSNIIFLSIDWNDTTIRAKFNKIVKRPPKEMQAKVDEFNMWLKINQPWYPYVTKVAFEKKINWFKNQKKSSI